MSDNRSGNPRIFLMLLLGSLIVAGLYISGVFEVFEVLSASRVQVEDQGFRDDGWGRIGIVTLSEEGHKATCVRWKSRNGNNIDIAIDCTWDQ